METNNKLREALSEIVSDAKFAEKELEGEFGSMTNPWSYVTSMADIARSALSTPPRNCDVGSVAEQKERFKDFCKEGKLSRIDLGAYCAYDCPCRDSYDCKLEWAQMPYEEGGEK